MSGFPGWVHPELDLTDLPDDDLPGMWSNADFTGGRDYELDRIPAGYDEATGEPYFDGS